MNYIYGSGSMGFGNGYIWHKIFNYKFPSFPIVTKTITLNETKGYPFAIVKIGNTIYNHVSHHNNGYNWFLENILNYKNDNLIVSIAGSDIQINELVFRLNNIDNIKGIQLSFSCPNVKDMKNKNIPKSKHPLYLKLNYLQDPYKYDLNKIKGILVNSVPCWFGGMSGKLSQKYNWPYIKKFNKEGLNIYGSSFVTLDDINYLNEYCGCKTISISSTMLTNPSLIENLKLDQI